jgi:flagellar hook-associated protein 2
MSGTASVGGLISGIDTNSMLDKLYEVSRAPVRRLQAKQNMLRAQLAAWSQLESTLQAFRASALALSTPEAFHAQKATITRLDLADATATASAQPGSYTFTVERLAQSHQIASQGYADIDRTEVGSGTISIAVGEGEAVPIAVDGFTLAELRDAINGADAGVRAAIINDGSSSPYRLIVTSETSGAPGQMLVETSLSGGSAPAFADLQAAQDAEIKLGSGAGAITVTSSSNRVQWAVPGVTLDLLKAEPGAPVLLTLSQDAAVVQKQITDFVDAYNAAVDFFASQFYYDPDTGETGLLFADPRLEALQRDLGAAVTNEVMGLTGGSRALAAIGVRTLSNGKLSVDSAALASAFAAKPEDVARVFAAWGEPTDAAVSYLTSGEDTRPSGSQGWAVEITQAATRARVTAGVAQVSALDADETLTVGGITINLTTGMTQAQVLAAINAHESETGVSADATGADGTGVGNYLTLTRTGYGSVFHIGAGSTRSNQSGVSSGFGSLTVTEGSPTGEAGLGSGAAGRDVQGTIGSEAATGAGQMLTGAAGASKGLALLVTANTPGSYGTIVFTMGAAAAALGLTISATDTVDGTIAAAQSSLENRVANMDEEVSRLQATADRENERMRAAFARMERALGQFQAQSQYLSGQLSQIANSGPGASKG